MRELIPVYVHKVDVHARADMKIEPYLIVHLSGWKERLQLAWAALRTKGVVLGPSNLDLSEWVGWHDSRLMPETIARYGPETAVGEDEEGVTSITSCVSAIEEYPMHGFFEAYERRASVGDRPLDSTGKRLKVGDRVRWRGHVYTIKAFGHAREKDDSTSLRIWFDEELLTPGDPYEFQCDLVCRSEDLGEGL